MALTLRSPGIHDAVESEDRLPLETLIDDWPGVTEFAELGELYDRVLVTGIVTVGFFRSYNDDSTAVFAASTRPHIVGMGANEGEAVRDWLLELVEKWSISKSLRPPFTATVENDIDAMKEFMEAVSDGSPDS